MQRELPAVGALKRALLKLAPVRSANAWRRARRDAALLDPAHPERAPILVYQMAKVGSSTVTATLRALDPPRRPVLKVHYLSREGVQAERAWDRRRGGPLHLSYQGAIGLALGARLRQVGGHFQLPVVTLVRDPIAREVSGLFQLLPWLRDPKLLGPDGAPDPERLVAHLEERFESGEALGSAERWFDRELRQVFDVDVFGVPFPRDAGHSVIRGPSARLLVLRTEDLDRTLAPALASFLDLPKEPAVVRANERRATPLAGVYAEVRRKLRLDAALVDRIYAGRMPRHFYDSASLEAFRRRWSR